ncbi:hypothetical protein [Micromonospora sp. WMMD1082]|uniref:hypothetical protein n=1 Tax=Micromonospora sp. WMMD1082 TaxID=3016104 RepID=UPI002417727A|nr:hypothetical protein [Micromonospora sp. WMMD1082]MDG4793658.1 hypothetical protein [Micromonospora sp. WMMD1082]
MTPTPPVNPAPDTACPEPSTATAAAVVGQEAAAWRHLTHALGVELRRRLIPLVRANLVPLEVACRILRAAGLPALPEMWTVHIAANLRRRASSTSPHRAVTAFRDDLHQTVRRVLGLTATVAFEQPPQALAAGPRDDSGHRRYETWGQPVITAVVRAETGHQARTTAVAALTVGLAELPGVEASLGATDAEPDLETDVELDVDIDAPRQPCSPPPVHRLAHLTEACTARRLAMQAWQYQVRQIRAALIEVLIAGDIDDRPGCHAPYGLVDDLLRDLGLTGLPHAHLYEITVAIPLTVTADTPAAARLATYRAVRDASATCPQYGLPITVSATHREPDIVADGEDRYRVTWHDSYLVCLRGAHCTRLAEQAARLQLGVLADELPQVAPVPLSTVYLGEYIDHRLDPDRD